MERQRMRWVRLGERVRPLFGAAAPDPLELRTAEAFLSRPAAGSVDPRKTACGPLRVSGHISSSMGRVVILPFKAVIRRINSWVSK